MRNVTKILVLLCALLLCSYEVMAEDKSFTEENKELTHLFSDGMAVFVTDYDGTVYTVNSESMLMSKTDLNVEHDVEYPLVADGELLVYSNNGGALECTTSDGMVHSLVAPDELLIGCDSWLIMDVQKTCNQVYFYFYDTINEVSAICCNDCEVNDVLCLPVDNMIGYFCDEAGKTYVATYDPEQEATTVLNVNWEDMKTQEVFSLSGRYAHFQSIGNNYYAINTVESCFVQICEGREMVSIHSPYAAAVNDSAIVNGEYWVCGPYGLYTPFWEETTQEKRILKVQGSGPNTVDQEFLLNHPDVQIEYVPSTAYESVGVYNAIISGVVELDVCLIDTSVTAEAFLKKGYTLDLATYPELRDKARLMYNPIQEFIFSEDKLLFIPYSMDLGAILEYREDALELAGMSTDDLPQTIEGLLDLIISWEDDEIVPLLFDESPHKELLLRVIESYISYCRHTNNTISFDAPTFRQLLAKTRTAASVSKIQSSEYNPTKLLVQVGSEIPGINSVVFPLIENEYPRYTGRLFGWAVVANSEETDLAVEYVIFRMGKLSKATEVLLYDGVYEAIEREYFATLLAEWKTELDQLQVKLAAEDNPIIQRDIQEQIDRIKKQIENPLDSLRYEITSDEIAFYQEEVVPGIVFEFSDPITDSSVSSLWAMQLIEQYTTGIISDDKFVKEMDKRIWMMEMEAGGY